MRRLYDPQAKGQLNIVAFISGSGTNLERILELEASMRDGEGSHFRVQAVCADRLGTRIDEISEAFSVPSVVFSLDEFCRDRGVRRADHSVRPEYFDIVMNHQLINGADAFVLAGYKVLMPENVLTRMGPMVFNVHPADLSIRDPQGRAVYIGEHGVRDAILSGETQIRSSTQIATGEMDCGPPLLISAPVNVKLPVGITIGELKLAQNRDLLRKISSEHQDRLKAEGDWFILPRTILEVARGNFALENDGTIHYFNGSAWIPIPRGLDATTNTPR